MATYHLEHRAPSPGVRIVSSPDDLRTLPRDSVVIDSDGDAWQTRQQDQWDCASPDVVHLYASDDLFGEFAPLTVVYTPKEQS